MEVRAERETAAKKRRALRYNILKIQRYEKCNYTNVRRLCAQVTKHHGPKNLYREVERLIEKQASSVCRIIVDGLTENNLKEWKKFFNSLQKVSTVMNPVERLYVRKNNLKSVTEIGIETFSALIASDGYMRYHFRKYVIPAYNNKESEDLFPLYVIAMNMIENIERSIPWEDMYVSYNLIGHGNFGRVFEARNRSSTNAVKVIQHKTMKNVLESKEIDISLTTSHESIVACKQAWIEKRKDLPGYMVNSQESSMESEFSDFESDSGDGSVYLEVIVMEFCESSLRQVLNNRNEKTTTITALDKIRIIRDLVSGLGYLHSKDIIHRDLKPENVLIKGNTCKICDFGLATFHKNTRHSRNKLVSSMLEHTPGVGTLLYTAPEVRDELPYGPEVDFYSLGVIVLELATPFSTIMELSKAIELRDQIDYNDPDFSWKYLASLLMKCEPRKRPSYVSFDVLHNKTSVLINGATYIFPTSR